MRADMSASPCDPSLPSGFPNIPGGSGTSPCTPRRRKQSTHKIRHLNGTLSAQTNGSPNAQASSHPRRGSSNEEHSLFQDHHPGYAPLPETDPQTLQEKKELLEYFQKLRVLVPSLPKTGKIPNLDVIEHVINYIKQLERQLVGHPMIQVLENNAYISGLLQSMAPEFDISHLFPTQHSLINGSMSSGSSLEGDNNNNNSNSSSSNPLTPSDSAQHLLRQNLLRYSSETVQRSSSPTQKLKTRKSSVRKPLTLLSSTNSSM